jgi:hypothetical protein
VGKTFICAAFMLLAVAEVSAGDLESARYDRVSRVLFPETRAWLAVDSLPSPDAGRMRRDRWLLRSIYLKTPQRELMEEPDCSFITRALYEHFDLGLFHHADLDGDGSADVVYCGPAECSEGSAAVIWFGEGNELAKRNVEIIPFLLLGCEMRGERGISGVAVGCCSDIVDAYFLADVRHPEWGTRLRVHKALSMPEMMEMISEEYVARGTLSLLLAPTRDETYRPNTPPWTPGATFKNVVAEYSPGAKGTLVASYRDGAGRRWGLVVVNDASKDVRISSPDEINVGWVRIK